MDFNMILDSAIFIFIFLLIIWIAIMSFKIGVYEKESSKYCRNLLNQIEIENENFQTINQNVEVYNRSLKTSLEHLFKIIQDILSFQKVIFEK